MRTFLSIMIVAGLLSTQAGCAKRGKGISKADKEMLKEHILDDMPADVTHKVDVNFEDKVHLLGWKAEPEIAAPGSTVRFTLFWKKTGDLDPGWKLFTHVTTDDPKQAKGNLDCVGAIRQEKGANCASQMYPPSEWEKNKVIKDTFEFSVPPDVTWPTYRFLVGIWKDDARLKVKNADMSDGDNRANIVTLPTGVKAPEAPAAPQKTEIPKMNAPKFGKADIKIDGKMDEKAWANAGFSGPFVGPGDGKTPPDHPVNAAAKVGWDDTNLYVGFVVEDKDPTSPFKAADKDPHIWEKSSAVELMIQPGDPGDNKDYFEIQVDINGAIFDTKWDDYNQPITGDTDANKKFGHMDWSSGLKQATFVDKEKKNYTTEIAIPWASFKARDGIAIPPKPGDTWRVNLYSFKDGQRSALGWSAIHGEGNFHKSTRFGKITFAGPGGVVPAASASASASASAVPSAVPNMPPLPHPVMVPPQPK